MAPPVGPRYGDERSGFGCDTPVASSLAPPVLLLLSVPLEERSRLSLSLSRSLSRSFSCSLFSLSISLSLSFSLSRLLFRSRSRSLSFSLSLSLSRSCPRSTPLLPPNPRSRPRSRSPAPDEVGGRADGGRCGVSGIETEGLRGRETTPAEVLGLWGSVWLLPSWRLCGGGGCCLC